MSNKSPIPTRRERFEAAVLTGAIGDAWGAGYENYVSPIQPKTFYLHPVETTAPTWMLTDDTQLTLASCEALTDARGFSPQVLAEHLVRYYREQRIAGIGASTLKAVQELSAGAHWSQAGRTGEYAAGNGAAMRIMPLAFYDNISRDDIRDSCRITHRNDEAYAGALAVVLTLRAILNGAWTGEEDLLDMLIQQLPDTNVRDRFITISAYSGVPTIPAVAALGNNGYVVNSVPFAIFAATRAYTMGIETMLQAVIDAGGDTDTNASIAGQIAGCLLGIKAIPLSLLEKLQALPDYPWMQRIITQTINSSHFTTHPR
ncbi:ADP-ribosylglycohydrolase family protein [Chitinophaga agri]|uniref:ADP-ribosylglycohydrolase family protein n=1 Tax=Chitinophaga agri TaxID=2703787 RepID=A0A6B9ZHE4_9BACT|nr:ADP-ribosylglycohydrolase family protein [Chitinophaga agri]QHS60023.1 hypothetical protein GWR21_10575 [Chitinophaga agri]